MEHEPVAPLGHEAWKALQALRFLRPFQPPSGQRGPKRAIRSLHDHHATAPAIEFVALVSSEGAHITAVRIIKEKTVGIVDHPRSGEKMAERNCAAIVHSPNPGDNTIIVLDQTFAVLRRAIGARRLSQRVKEAGLNAQIRLSRRAYCLDSQ